MSDIVERIKRLLALSQSDNVNEAAAAAAKAAELMAKHQIDQATLDVGEPEEPILQEDLDELGGKAQPWRGVLARSLAEATGCHVYFARVRRLRNNTVVLRAIGTAGATATVRYMLGYLTSEVERLCEKGVAANKAEWAEMGRGFNARAWRGSFRLGAAGEISKRVKASSEKAQLRLRAGAPGAALARIDSTSERVEAVAKSLGLSASRAPTISNSSAYRAGQRAGASVALGGHAALGSGAKAAIR